MNSIGTNIILTLFGESHGEAIGAVLDGMTPGIKIDEEFIASQLSKRRPQGVTDTSRREKDKFKIISGVFNGYTTGAPICIIIPNEDTRSGDYSKTYGLARPSHADYTAHIKYDGYEDYRGGGHFSGRITAAIVAAGAIAIKALENKGIRIGTHILSCGGVTDADFNNFEGVLDDTLDTLNKKSFPVINNIEDSITEAVTNAKNSLDSIGGVVQTAVTGLETGIGEPWFDSLEGVISKAVFALGGVKGIEFGAGFSLAGMKGSEANDPFCITDGYVRTTTNHNGGINGGISNGMPIVFNTAVKPTPSIAQSQKTINFITGKEDTLNLTGRHDPAIVRRICIVISSLVAIVLCDMLAIRHGQNYLK